MPNIAAFLSYVMIVSFTPGPNVVLSIANANQFGYKKTFKFLFGIFMGFFVIMLSSNYFNLFLFQIIPKIKIVMGIIGAIYMTYLAITIMKSSAPKSGGTEGRANTFLTGFLLQFINPKLILYAITVSSSFIVPYYQSNLMILLLTLFLSLLIFISVNMWALFGAFFKRFLSNYHKAFNIIMGLMLIYCALSISNIIDLIKSIF